MVKYAAMLLLTILFVVKSHTQNQKENFSYLDVFALQYVQDPQISPDGKSIVYRRSGFDIMKDRSKGDLWIMSTDGNMHQKLSSNEAQESSPRWSPDGDRIAYICSTKEGAEVYMYWVNSGKLAKISQLPYSPSSLTWSPSGKQLAFTMHIPVDPPIAAKIPKKPEGAEWADEPRLTDRLKHEADGKGYIKAGFHHIFVLSAYGGTARQVTTGNYQHEGKLSWSPRGDRIYFSGNRTENWEYDFRNSDIYSVDVNTGEFEQLTDRNGPDNAPVVSPDGKWIAYTGYEDKVQAYQVTKLHLMRIDGSDKKILSDDLDRSVSNVVWNSNSDALYFSYDDKGNSKIAQINMSGKVTKLTDNLGGTTIGRPYGSGSFSVSDKGQIAFTLSTPEFPAELGVVLSKSVKQLTNLNDALLNYRTLGKVEEIWYKSSVDQRDIQGWIVYPPGFDKNKKYPMMVENHGGPILNYGDRFSAEMQLYAAAGYVVFYPNPRGSTSYGEEFANLLFNNYPGEDYNDVMDGVDVLIEKGLAHEDRLFVAGGSAGGIMTAWIIGKNNRFEAAAVVKPVMNWISKTLVADNYFYYANSRYPGQPWENFETYWKFSPVSLVGNIETPTLVMVGMDDLRTPPSEAKQLYHALKLRKIETLLMEIPEAGHGIAAKPSNLIRKVANTLAWFEKYNKTE